MLNCRDPETIARFWCEVLGYVELDRDGDDIEIGPAAGFGGAAPTMILTPVAGEKTEPLRLHLDVNPVDRDQDAELERLLALGARPADVGQSGEESWHVLADPEGNEFCLLARRLPEL
ncbi:VOC family protein [Nocardioides rotundus]|nr:VOC family protein [Nocardioides rotundus]